MTKSEFVDQVADRAGLSKKDAGDAVDAMLETIEGALKRGSDVTFSGFGKFSVSQRSAREGRNPATGEKIQIAASRVPKFTAGAGSRRPSSSEPRLTRHGTPANALRLGRGWRSLCGRRVGGRPAGRARVLLSWGA